MLKFCFYKFLIIIFLIFANSLKAEIINEIEVKGNQRISSETIIIFSGIKKNDDINVDDINAILKNLYDTNFFENISIVVNKNKLIINVLENPIIENINFNGIKAKKILDEITKDLNLKSRSSYNEILLNDDKIKISNSLKNLGYFFSTLEISVINLEDNKVNIDYKINLGEKAKISKITFTGNKVFKDRKLKSIIISEEYKFWKFISGKKFLNQSLIDLDNRLLKNFYLNNGYYNVVINSSFAKLVDENNFEIIYNINANDKFYFNEIDLIIPIDFDKSNFSDIENLFLKIKGKQYSLDLVSDIIDKVQNISMLEQYESIKTSVQENIIGNKINLSFKIDETEKFVIEKINIFGNNVTRENVIRNQFEIDEGDRFNELLVKKSLNNLKSLNFFKDVNQEIIPGSNPGFKVINIKIEEKPTGEISAGAGVGTSGGTVSFGVRENNYLGKGLAVISNLTLNEESIKGMFSIVNNNFNNTDKSVYFTLESTEVDRLTDFGYKNTKSGFLFGTNFEYFDDLFLGIGNSTYYEKIEADTTASALQKKKQGDYFDSFLTFDFNYDKRNRKFQTNDGFISSYNISLPIISDTNTLTNTYNYRIYKELYEENISSISFFAQSSNSISGDDIKLSERLFVPSNKLRGFERGKVGPKDGDDFIGGNFISTVNFSTTIPQFLPNSQNIDFLLFFDAANIWGVDYNSALDDSNKIRSSIGVGVDWLTPIGPLNFSLSEPLTKGSSDKTESFRFSLGTTF